MNTEEKLREKIGSNPGFKVPEGYFDEIYAKIANNLPERQPIEQKPLTKWQRVRPYVYLAAMFAGIWCMMKMLNMMTIAPEVSFENPPALVAEAMTNSETIEDVYVPMSDVSEEELMSTIAEEYDSFDEFVDEFDYEFDENVSEIDFSEIDLTEFSSDEFDVAEIDVAE